MKSCLWHDLSHPRIIYLQVDWTIVSQKARGTHLWTVFYICLHFCCRCWFKLWVKLILCIFFCCHVLSGISVCFKGQSVEKIFGINRLKSSIGFSIFFIGRRGPEYEENSGTSHALNPFVNVWAMPVALAWILSPPSPKNLWDQLYIHYKHC